MNAHPFLPESVKSFEMGLVEKSGNYIGACIKFRRFDAPDVMTHWPDSHLQRLRYRLAYISTKKEISRLARITLPRNQFHCPTRK